MITFEQIHNQIAEAIKQSKLTHSEIAEQLGIKETTLEKYILGKALPSVYVFAKLCQVLNLNSNEILCLKSYNKIDE